MVKYSTYKNSIKEPKVKIIKKVNLYKKYFEMNEYHFSHTKYDGSMSKVFSREVLERGHAVGVIPYDPKTDEVVLIEQFRPGAYLAGENPWLLEIVAGIIDEGETPKQVAIRETKEESGLEVTELKEILSHIATPGACTESLKLFIAKVDAKKHLDTAGLEDESEDIKVFHVKTDEAIKLLEEGKFYNATSVIAMQWLALNKSKLKTMWD
jgi:ADP-ribose pyrophosphatase